jgi:pimeloyl-ACP methyl ester carboxylesterase/uncharacterized protein (DUF362 family)
MNDPIVLEFETQLAALARTYAGRPREELDLLWVLGIEREAIVTIAYRRSVIEDRLRKMPVDEEARAVISRAIRWAWRDEQAHTLWVRGALLRRNERSLRFRALRAHLEGVIGGWVSSRQNHERWSEAPLSRLVAEALELAGAASGRIPIAVREALHWNTFSDFCRFNRSAETTAAMAWQRMAALARELGHPDAEGFARMAEDEARHAKIFTVLASALDTNDRLTCTVGELRAALHGVGTRFVATPDKEAPAWRNPLGKGGTVFVREDADPSAAMASVLEALALGPLEGKTVALKTTFMLVAHARDRSPGVSIRVLRAAVDWLAARGAKVRVIDARNHYDQFVGRRNVAEVARYLGLHGVDIVDAQEDQVPHEYTRGMGVATVSRAWRDAGVRILLGKLRGHPAASALLSLEAAEGIDARIDAHLFAERRAERETVVLMGLDAHPPTAALLDAFEDVPDGLMGILGSDRALHPRRIYGSRDPVALDVVVSEHIGTDPSRDQTLVTHALDWFGDPRGALRVDGPNTPIARFRLPNRSPRTAVLSALAMPVFRYASARGELFLPDFDEEAFPPLSPATFATRAARHVVRRIVDDRAPPAGELLRTHTVDGVRIARLGKGPPIVLLHGYPETLQVWSRVATRLAREREVIAFDWPGLGYSVGRDGPADPDALAEQLRDVLDSLGLSRVDLAGADMGAPPALVFAAKYQERTGTVIVLSSLLFGDEPTSIEIRIMRRANLAGTAFSLAPDIVYHQCKRTFLPSGETLAPELDADFGDAFRRPHVRARLARMCEDYERAFDWLPGRYWQIRRPVRLLWAEHSGHFPPSHADRMCAILPEARRVVIPGAKHWMAISRADEVAHRMAAFLSEAK